MSFNFILYKLGREFKQHRGFYIVLVVLMPVAYLFGIYLDWLWGYHTQISDAVGGYIETLPLLWQMVRPYLPF